jgi:photosystem II stability/assembly factor-like uncharacterized protein
MSPLVRPRYSAICFLSLALAGAATASSQQPAPAPPAWRWTALPSPTDVELRGLSAPAAAVMWASGTHGTVVHTADGGRSWARDTVPGASALDFRAVAATSAQVAHVLSAGDSSRLYRTTDGGRSWSLRFVSTRKGSFFDAIRFWDARHGIAMSDPVDGKFLLVTTSDGGRSWREIPANRLPAALPGEGAFAASGSCLAVLGEGDVWFATGGAASARVFHSSDRGRSWTVHDTPIRAGAASAGIFSIAFRDRLHGVVAGGDYKLPTLGGRNVAVTHDGGVTWTLVDSTASPAGYRSAVAYTGVSGQLVAVGLSGSDLSVDDGATWRPMDTVAYNSALWPSHGSTGWAVGPNGRIARASR